MDCVLSVIRSYRTSRWVYSEFAGHISTPLRDDGWVKINSCRKQQLVENTSLCVSGKQEKRYYIAIPYKILPEALQAFADFCDPCTDTTKGCGG